MLDRVLFRKNDENFVLGLGCKDAFILDQTLNWKELDQFISRKAGKTLFITISYQLGFPLLQLQSKHQTILPLLRIWEPDAVFEEKNGRFEWQEGETDEHFSQLAKTFWKEHPENFAYNWKPQIDKSTYLNQVGKLKAHIQRGDIYEINFCQQLEAQHIELTEIKPHFQKLWKHNPTPFAGMVETSEWMLASASPERYIQKIGSKLISQPIKGTAPRKQNATEDLAEKLQLQTSLKERAENVMIVDLVRNDLSKIAQKGSVCVDELCEIYSFPTVHQMISTISCQIKQETSFSDIIQASFPMGSMTGAPKKSAVHLADEHEAFPRNFYSGSLGIVYPNGDFDLNVLIRSLFYDRAEKTLSCAVGGAITMLSDPKQEYEECRVKVGKIIQLFGTCQW